MLICDVVVVISADITRIVRVSSYISRVAVQAVSFSDERSSRRALSAGDTNNALMLRH